VPGRSVSCKFGNQSATCGTLCRADAERNPCKSARLPRSDIDIPAVIDPRHLDPTQKDWNIGSKIGRVSDEDLLAELAKCVPVCRTHHQLIEDEARHGGDALSVEEVVALIRKSD
jgi:hypothetical protein